MAKISSFCADVVDFCGPVKSLYKHDCANYRLLVLKPCTD